jgi:hypothetical protein
MAFIPFNAPTFSQLFWVIEIRKTMKILHYIKITILAFVALFSIIGLVTLLVKVSFDFVLFVWGLW